MPKFSSSLAADYNKKWRTLKIDYEPEAVKSVAKKIFANRAKYQGYWNVPYWFIGLCDYRESGFHPKGVLHNGQRIIGTNQVTTIVPKGRGPFATWREATRDALQLKGLHKINDWSIARASYLLEGFNGFGYRNKGVPSPYLYSHTNHYKDGSWDDDARGGKYTRDHYYDPNVYDKQLGALAILKALCELDPSIEGKLSAPPPPPDVEPVQKKEKTKPIAKSKTVWASILAAITTVIGTIGEALSDWRVWCAVIVLVLLGYLIWERQNRPDISGWFK
jgi:lysozyme family protein